MGRVFSSFGAGLGAELGLTTGLDAVEVVFLAVVRLHEAAPKRIDAANITKI